MTLINADVFLQYLIFSKHIDNLKCKEVKEAIEMSKVDIFDKIKTEIASRPFSVASDAVLNGMKYERQSVLEIIDKYKLESEE